MERHSRRVLLIIAVALALRPAAFCAANPELPATFVVPSQGPSEFGWTEFALPDNFTRQPLTPDRIIVNTQSGIRFALPRGASIGEVYQKQFPVLRFSLDPITNIRTSDGVCGGMDQTSVAEQKRALEKAVTEPDAVQALLKTTQVDFGILDRRKDLTIVAGFQNCQGDVENNDLVTNFDAEAVLFHKGYRISLFLMGIPAPTGLTVADSDKFVQKVKRSKTNSSTEIAWENFVRIVHSIAAQGIASH